jgi:excisionase family DNA binding protein
MPPESKYMRVRGIAALLDVKEDVVLGWIKRGELPAHDVSTNRGRRPRWRIASADLDLFLESRSASPARPSPRRARRRDQHIIQFF